MKKVLVVCHGNICRSPVFSSLISNNFEVRQASLKSYFDENWKSSRAAKKIRVKAKELFGIDLEDYRSRKLDVDDFLWCDLCVYFDNGNFKRIVEILRRENIKELCTINAGMIIGKNSIKDPNFMSPDSKELEEVLKDIKLSSEEFIRRFSV